MNGARNREALILDHAALLAAGAGNRVVSRLISNAHRDSRRRLYTPVLCLAAAAAQRVALADHVGSLPALAILDIGLADARPMGVLLSEGTDWPTAHAVVAARPRLEWPSGLPVVTTQPKLYAGLGVITLAVR